jgi:hypothetical protein
VGVVKSMEIRKVISQLATDAYSLDDELLIYILIRNKDGIIIEKIKCPTYKIVNNKIYIEEDYGKIKIRAS